MDQYILKGKIINADNSPLKNGHVLAYDADDFLNPDDFLGETLTNEKGLFNIQFDNSRFSGGLEFLEGTPDVYLLVKDSSNGEQLKTQVAKTKKELEYHVKISHQLPESNFKDIYAGNAQRMIASLREIGDIIGREASINLDIFSQSSKTKETRDMTSNLRKEYEQRKDNFNHLFIALSSLVNSYVEELRIGPIGYDGPQVSRFPRKEEYDLVISWPHKEKFKWE